MPAGIGYGKKKRDQKESRKVGIAYTGGPQAARRRERDKVDKAMDKAMRDAAAAKRALRQKHPKSPPPKSPSSVDRMIGWLTGNNPLTEALGSKNKKGQRR